MSTLQLLCLFISCKLLQQKLLGKGLILYCYIIGICLSMKCRLLVSSGLGEKFLEVRALLLLVLLLCCSAVMNICISSAYMKDLSLSSGVMTCMLTIFPWIRTTLWILIYEANGGLALAWRTESWAGTIWHAWDYWSGHPPSFGHESHPLHICPHALRWHRYRKKLPDNRLRWSFGGDSM